MEKNGYIVGTNCFNCRYSSDNDEMVGLKELNNQGGIDPQNDEEMHRAKKADLITLPGGTKSDAITKRFCNNGAVRMYVTVRMCCAYWDNAAVRRPWERVRAPQYLDQIF